MSFRIQHNDCASEAQRNKTPGRKKSLIFTVLQWPGDGTTSTSKKERAKASELQTVVNWHR